MDMAPPTYDLSYRDTFWADRSYEDQCDRIALRALLKERAGHLLDVGAGFGRLVDEYRDFDAVTLLDSSPAMIEAARQRVGPDRRVSIVEADATRMPIASGSIDVAVAVRLFVHLRDPTVILGEIARVLRPGGSLIVEFPNRHHLLASVRYLTGRQRWSPAAPGPHEYREGHFSHQPATIERQLRASGFAPDARRAVSLFRSHAIKGLVSSRLLTALEAPLQGPLGGIAPAPSIYVRSTRLDRAAAMGLESVGTAVRQLWDVGAPSEIQADPFPMTGCPTSVRDRGGPR